MINFAARRLALIFSLLGSALLPTPPLIAQSIVDYGDPASVVNAVFRAARNERFAVLAELCDPEEENDDTTQRICDLPETEDDHAEFVEAFEIGEISGEVRIDKKAGFAIVPITANDRGDSIKAFFTLILRNPDIEEGEWYLYCLGEEPCVEIEEAIGTPNTGETNTGENSQKEWKPTSTQNVGKGRRNEAYGIPSLSIGDVNGDGFDDLAVGSFGNPDEGMAGRVQVYHGSNEGVTSKVAWRIGNKEWRDQLGDEHAFAPLNIGRLGDINGDGYDDLGITAADLASDDPLVAVLVYHGSKDGLEKESYKLAAPKQEDLLVGGKLLSAGDVNGDGFGDVLVVSYDKISGPAVAALYLGAEDGLEEEPSWVEEGLNVRNDTALAASAARDVNGDGYDDLLLGSTATTDDPVASVRLYLGSEEGLDSEPVWQQSNRESTSTLGISAAGLGDVDGDGLADFAFAYSEPEAGLNQVYLYLGRNEPADLEQLDVEDAQIIEIKTRRRQSIRSVAAAGDVNGDGHADLLVAVGEETKSGRWRWQLLLGGSEGINPNPVFTTDSASIDSSLLQIHPMESGDLNGDGYTDLVFGEAKFDFAGDQEVQAGNAQIVYGGPGGEARTNVTPTPLIAVPQPPSAKLNAGELVLTGEREVKIEEGRIYSLSPDGQWLLIERDKHVCVVNTSDTTFEPQHCVSWREELRSVDWDRVRWSPDSQRVAFTENSLVMFVDSDIWVYEIEQDLLRNLTDDGKTANLLKEEEPIAVDISPAWSPDGKRILFVRSTRVTDGWDGTKLYTIDLDESEPTFVHTISSETPFTVYTGLHWQPDSNTIFYTYASADLKDRKNGIWRYQIESDKSAQLVKNDEEHGVPQLAVVTTDNRELVFFYPRSTIGVIGTFILRYGVDSETITPIESELAETQEVGTPLAGVSFATYSPDGAKLLLMLPPIFEDTRLIVCNLPEGEEFVLLESKQPIYANIQAGTGVQWANDDTIFIATAPNKGKLFRITAK